MNCPLLFCASESVPKGANMANVYYVRTEMQRRVGCEHIFLHTSGCMYFIVC